MTPDEWCLSCNSFWVRVPLQSQDHRFAPAQWIPPALFSTFVVKGSDSLKVNQPKKDAPWCLFSNFFWVRVPILLKSTKRENQKTYLCKKWRSRSHCCLGYASYASIHPSVHPSIHPTQTELVVLRLQLAFMNERCSRMWRGFATQSLSVWHTVDRDGTLKTVGSIAKGLSFRVSDSVLLLGNQPTDKGSKSFCAHGIPLKVWDTILKGCSTLPDLLFQRGMAMGQNPVPPVNIPIPTKIGSKMGGELTDPKMGSQNGFDNHSHMGPTFFSWGKE